MIFDGKVLILDNFRIVLREYSVDVQDIVRSAILDDIDISEYITQCKDNPYRLEQIRLAMKDNIDSDFLEISSGGLLYRIRCMCKKSIDISLFKRYINSVNAETLGYLLSWMEEGLPISNLQVSRIPMDMLSVFDYGIRKGYDMSEFNNGKSYPEDRVRVLLKMQANNKKITRFLTDDWKLDVLSLLSNFSSKDQKVWDKLLKYIEPTISMARLEPLVKCVSEGIPIKDINSKSEDGRYIYELGCIEIFYKGCIHSLDRRELLRETSERGMREVYEELYLEKQKHQNISGRLRKGKSVS